MPFTRINLKNDPEDVGALFDGAPDLEFRAATKPLELGEWDTPREGVKGRRDLWAD